MLTKLDRIVVFSDLKTSPVSDLGKGYMYRSKAMIQLAFEGIERSRTSDFSVIHRQGPIYRPILCPEQQLLEGRN